MLDREDLLDGRRRPGRCRRREDEYAVQPGRARVRAGRTALPHRVRRQRRRDRRRAARAPAGTPPVATGFATGTPGANGLAFDEDRNLYVSDGGTGPGPRVPGRPSGGAATVLFRIQPMANSVGVGRQNQALQPGAPAAHAGDRRERARVRPERRPLRRRHGARRAVAGRVRRTAAMSARRPAATRRSRPTRSAWTRSSSSIPRSTARTASRSTATATCGWTRTSGTRSSSSTAAATSRSSSATRSAPAASATRGRSSSRRARFSRGGCCARRARTATGATTHRTPRARLRRAARGRRQGLVPRPAPGPGGPGAARPTDRNERGRVGVPARPSA